MYCKKCGSALPSKGYICQNCGTMMTKEQIKEQKEYNQSNQEEIELLSDKYRNTPLNRNYPKIKENKYLGAILIILIIIGILKVM